MKELYSLGAWQVTPIESFEQPLIRFIEATGLRREEVNAAEIASERLKREPGS